MPSLRKLFRRGFLLFFVIIAVGTVSAVIIRTRSRPTTYHVSRTGSNAGGSSWAEAWNELDQIDWDAIQPGDTILVDGGPTECSYPVKVTDQSNTPHSSSGDDCGMVYQSTLTVSKSGEPGNPITIRLADESGRNGTVRIFGGRSTPLPYCGQLGYVAQSARERGIYICGESYVRIDGLHWSGIMIYGHGLHGIWLHRCDQHDITIRNVEVFDNGVGRAGGPDQQGIYPVGDNLAFERVIVHDNGQDAFQTGYQMAVNNFMLKRSWLYNQRPHPTEEDEPFNYCTHSDGIQIYGGGDLYGLAVEDSIIGPGFAQGLILGDYGDNHDATVHNVTIRNTLIVHHHGASSNAGLLVKYEPDSNSLPTGYEIDHVTVVRDANTCERPEDCPSATWHSMYVHGSGHQVTGSIFVGGTYLEVEGDRAASHNFNWQVEDGSDIATEADPMFVDDEFRGVGRGFADFDFSLQPGSPAYGAGSSISSVAQLLTQPDPD